ncbi:hypothetical protein [Kineococcus terrestris]|uniref:hypothetical protein n=1 Tax=Kineococcus terrestris TaxID=2044856 RepID=UPI0034DB6E9C
MTPARHLAEPPPELADLLEPAPAPAPVPAAPAEDPWRSAWSAALRAVELDVADAERLIERLHSDDEAPEAPPARDWIAPALPGPVPAEFAELARELLQRQLNVSERLAEAMVQTRSQRRALAKLDRAERPPVFVDRAL